MKISSSQERPKVSVSRTKLSVFRRAGSPELSDLCENLIAQCVSYPGVEVYKPDRGTTKSTRVELIKGKEVLDNLRFLNPKWFQESDTHARLHEEVPSLKGSRPVQAVAVNVNHNPRKESFISLHLDGPDKDTLSEERHQAWEALEEMIGLDPGSLSWRDYAPDIKLAFAPSWSIPEYKANVIGHALRALMPLAITLDAAELPADSMLGRS